MCIEVLKRRAGLDYRYVDGFSLFYEIKSKSYVSM